MAEQTDGAQKGRSRELHARRNEAVADRWYFYGILKRLQYLDAVKETADDFFLSKHTVPEIITEQFSYIQQLKKQEVDARELSRKWRHLRWDI